MRRIEIYHRVVYTLTPSQPKNEGRERENPFHSYHDLVQPILQITRANLISSQRLVQVTRGLDLRMAAATCPLVHRKLQFVEQESGYKKKRCNAWTTPLIGVPITCNAF